jgi:hypothetical protein
MRSHTHFRVPRYAGHAHTVVAIGWIPEGPATVPAVAVISNFDPTIAPVRDVTTNRALTASS